MVFNQKPRKPMMLIANSSITHKVIVNLQKINFFYNLSLHTHNETHFHQPQILKLASATHTEGFLTEKRNLTKIIINLFFKFYYKDRIFNPK